ncbi:MAG TPA: beta-N-acetylhexosaminidase [Armatimonadota bacterium]|jgi:hypothetical protein
MFRFARVALAALLAAAAPALPASLDYTVGRLHFTMSPGHNVRLTADGVPLIRESHFYMVTPGWTSTLLNADNLTPTISSSVSNGTYTGTAVYDNVNATVRYTYTLGPDDTYKVTINYVSKGPAAEIEWDMAYLNANVIAGRPWSASTVSGTRSGTVPIFATSSDQWASQLCPLVKTISFDTNLGPLSVAITGSSSSVRAFRLFDARAGTQDWAQRNPMFWFGIGVSPIPTAGQTITATWHLGTAPTRTTIPKLATEPVLREAPAARVPYVADMPVIPHPKESTAGSAPCRLGPNVYIAIPTVPRAEEQQAALELRSELSTYWGITPTIGSTPPANATTFTLGVSTDSSVPQVAEGYSLNVAANGVAVAGYDGRGVYNGAQTLKQLLRADANGVYVKAATIRDWPSLKMRGVHWFGGPNGLAFHKKMIDLIVAPYKLNTMLYECEFGYWASHPEIWDTSRGMTKADMQASVNYARYRFIEPIPLINSLGHADWMFTNGQHLDLATDATARYQYDPENPGSYTLLFDVMQEAADIFKPKYFHIGHDEVTTGGVFPKPGSTKTAGELIVADTVKINNWVKARGMRTMMWGDEFLHYPDEASDAGNAPSVAEAQTRRAGLPKDIVITDWHYDGTSTTYPSVPLWKSGGWEAVGVPWYDWSNIQNLSSIVTRNNAMGLIQSTWAGWSMYPDIVNTSAYNQFCAYLVAAEMAWSGASPKLVDLGYNPDDAFQKAWNRAAIDLKTYTGFLTDIGSGNAAMWSWIPGTHPTVPFPTGDQAWGGVEFSVASPIWLSGGLNPAGTWPQAVEIPVSGKKATELNALWGTSWIGTSGAPVARFKVTYMDGTSSQTAIVYGTQIFAFNDLRGGLQTATAWTGTDSVGQNVSVRRWTWKNPKPDAGIRTVTVTSETGEAAPILLGLTGLHPWVAPYTMVDAARALRLAAGLDAATSADLLRLNLVSDSAAAAVNLTDAVRVARTATGLNT